MGDDGKWIDGAIREQSGFLRARMRRLGVPEDRVDDAVQEVFVVVVRRIEAFDRSRPIRPWLAGIARRVAVGERRRAGQRSDELTLIEGSLGDAMTARAEQAAMVSSFLRHLDPEQLEVFLLTEVRGMTAREAGERLGLSPNTISTRLRAARRELHRLVARQQVTEHRWSPMLWLGLSLGGTGGAGRAIGRGGTVALLASAAVGIFGAALWSTSGSSCSSPARSAPSTQSAAPVGGGRVADPSTSVALGDLSTRAVDPAGARADTARFIWGGLGTLMRHDVDAEIRNGHRIDGDLVHIRSTISATRGDVSDMRVQFDAPGSKQVEGAARQLVTVEEGRSATADAVFQLTGDGAFPISVAHGLGEEGASQVSKYCFCREHDIVTRCDADVCVATSVDLSAAKTGEVVSTVIRSTCNNPLHLYLAPPDIDVLPVGARTVVLLPEASLTLGVDRGFHVHRYDPESGRANVSGSVDADGGELSFSCAGVSSTPPD